MLDSDLAKLYQCKNSTKSINLAVNRNKNKFSEDFYFKLSKTEYEKILRFQNETLELEQGKYSKYLPYAFTEQGVAMLASVLKTEVAAEVSVKIMRSFVMLKKYVSTNLIEQSYINKIVIQDNERITLLESTFEEFKEKKKVNEIYFKGQIYDAYSKILDILKEGENEVIRGNNNR